MNSPGTILRSARIRQKLELTELADRIKVNLKYLEAMEADDAASLPGGFFYKSFVRQYANALGIDSDEIEEALISVPIEEEPMPLPRPEDQKIRSLPRLGVQPPWHAIGRLGPSLAMLAAVLVGCSVFYSWWHRIQAHQNSIAPAKSRVVETRSITPQASMTPAPKTETSAVSSQPPPQPAPADGVHITLAATEDTWVHVTADGRTVFDGVIRGQQSRNVEGKQNMRVLIGNAGGLQIEWNGRQLESLGKRGEVRDVLFTPDGYRLIEKQPPSDDENAKPAQATT
jgi:hypothetical protein